ncbi:MAG: hypothetical protein KC477_07485 [Oceanospirillaceae bacterium]|nr:hypothetical protein [Oceanospirillaceae bacterium]
MSTESHLAQLGVTIEQARNFIIANVQNPSVIFNVAKQHGITNQMLAEIYGGVTAETVQAFFDTKGIDSSELDVADDNTDSPSIIGTWHMTEDAGEEGVHEVTLIFNTDGTWSIDESLTNPLDEEHNGIESGTYVWNPDTGSVQFNIQNDENGWFGFSDDADESGSALGHITVSEDSIVVVGIGNSEVNFELTGA